MENKKPKNPSAFPIVGANTIKSEGMTLRDHFAGLAMQGLYASGKASDFSKEAIEIDAVLFYNIADAMLKQREL